MQGWGLVSAGVRPREHSELMLAPSGREEHCHFRSGGPLPWCKCGYVQSTMRCSICGLFLLRGLAGTTTEQCAVWGEDRCSPDSTPLKNLTILCCRRARRYTEILNQDFHICASRLRLRLLGRCRGCHRIWVSVPCVLSQRDCALQYRTQDVGNGALSSVGAW